jgi:chromosome segregation ATPase
LQTDKQSLQEENASLKENIQQISQEKENLKQQLQNIENNTKETTESGSNTESLYHDATKQLEAKAAEIEKHLKENATLRAQMNELENSSKVINLHLISLTSL